jgi:hypothetical protein
MIRNVVESFASGDLPEETESTGPGITLPSAPDFRLDGGKKYSRISKKSATWREALA